MQNILKSGLAATLIASLSACGSGGSSDAADIYVGTWKSKCFTYRGDDGNTYIETRRLTLAKVAAAKLIATYSESTAYADSGCKQSLGAADPPENYQISIGSPSSFLGSTADYSVFTYADGVVRQGYLKADSTQLNLVIRDNSGLVPNAWSVAAPYTKQ